MSDRVKKDDDGTFPYEEDIAELEMEEGYKEEENDNFVNRLSKHPFEYNPPETVDFLIGFGINMSKFFKKRGAKYIPKQAKMYSDFEGLFKEPIDKALAELIMDSDVPEINDQMKKNFGEWIVPRIKKNNINVTHFQSLGIGRYYGHQKKNMGSIVTIPKAIKHTLFKFGGWTDVDMIAGHFSILLSVAKSNGYYLATFEKYINEIKTGLGAEIAEYYSLEGEEPLTVDDVKQLFCATLYGGGFATWVKYIETPYLAGGWKGKKIAHYKAPHDFYAEFKEEVHKLIEVIVYYNRGEKCTKGEKKKYLLYEYLMDNPKDDNDEMTDYSINQRLMSYFCQILENDILYKAYKILVGKGCVNPQRCALEYDGLCIPHHQNAVTESVIRDINNKIGIIDCYEFVQFKIKGYDTHAINSLINARNEMVIEEEKEEENDDIILEDFNGKIIELKPIYCYGTGNLKVVPHDFDSFKDALSATKMAEHFLSHLSYLVATTIDNAFYVYSNKRWFDETNNGTYIRQLVSKVLYNILYVYIDNNYVPINGDTNISKSRLYELLRQSCEKSGCVAIVQNIIAITREQNPKVFDGNKTLLGFENGVYDLKESIFRDYEYDDFITRSVGYDYEPIDFNDKDNIDRLNLMESILNQIMPIASNREFLLRIMAANLNGINSQRCFFFNGSGGNGKGMLQSLNKYILGLSETSGYFLKAKNEAMSQMGSTGGANEDIYSMNLRRSIVFSEIKHINGEILKGLSGDNTMSARPNYGHNRTIGLDANVICEFNNAPQLGHLDGGLQRRILYITFPSKFCDEANYKRFKKAGRPYIYKGNEEYVTESWGQMMKSTWLHMLLTYYKKHKEADGTISFARVPKNIVSDTEKYVLSEDVIGSAFHSSFELFTPDDGKKEYLTFKNVKEVILEEYSVKAKKTSPKQLEIWLIDKYGVDIMETPMRGVTDQYRKKLCLINVRRIQGSGDDVDEEEDNEYVDYEPDISLKNDDTEDDDTEDDNKVSAEEIGVSMADAADAETLTQTMTDINGRKIVLPRKAPK